MYSSINHYLSSKILSALGFVGILLNMFILLHIPQSSGYELSIYGAYPLIFWILMICSIIIAITIIILSFQEYTSYWVYGLLIIFICYSILLFLPDIRGYQFFARPSHDIFSHLSLVTIISNTGYLPKSLFYPMTHILVVSLSFFGFPLKLCTDILNVFFCFSYILFSFVLGIEILKLKRRAMIMLAFSFPLLFSFLHYSFIPYYFGLCVIPLFLYCFHKRNNSKSNMGFTFLTLIVSIFVIFLHPFIFLTLFLILILFYIKSFYSSRVFSSSTLNISTLFISLAVIFLGWYINFEKILILFNNVVSAIFFIDRNTIIESQAAAVNSSNADLSLIIEMFIKVYGCDFLYLCLSFSCLLYFIKKLNLQKINDNLFSYSIQYVGSLLLFLAMIVGYFVIYEPIRAMGLALVMSTIICGLTFDDMYVSKDINVNTKKILSLFVIFFVSSTSILGIFNLYESPWKLSSNSQMTKMDICGLDWFFKYKDSTIYPINPLQFYKYEEFYSQINNNYLPMNKSWVYDELPSHFGYDSNKYLAEIFDFNERYLITSEFMRQRIHVIPKKLWNSYPQYTNSDFVKLNKDPTVNKLYMNGELEVWNLPQIGDKT